MWQRLGTELNRSWRILGTGISFAVFGLGGFLLGVVVCMALRIIIPDSARYAQAVRKLVSRAFRGFIVFMWLLGVLRWRVTGLEHCQSGRAYLVVANHPTLIDIVFLLAHFEGAECIVKEGVLRNPAWGLLVRAAGYISNADPSVLVEAPARRLAAGRTVVMFPEGTRTSPGQPLAFGTAAGAIATRSGCSCLPVVIRCTPPTLYKGLPWYRVPAQRVEFHLEISPAWQVPPATGTRIEQRRAAHAFTGDLAAFFTGELSADRPGEPRQSSTLLYNAPRP